MWSEKYQLSFDSRQSSPLLECTIRIGDVVARDRPIDWVDRILLSEDDPEYDDQQASDEREYPQKDVEYGLVNHRRASLSVAFMNLFLPMANPRVTTVPGSTSVPLVAPTSLQHRLWFN